VLSNLLRLSTSIDDVSHGRQACMWIAPWLLRWWQKRIGSSVADLSLQLWPQPSCRLQLGSHCPLFHGHMRKSNLRFFCPIDFDQVVFIRIDASSNQTELRYFYSNLQRFKKTTIQSRLSPDCSKKKATIQSRLSPDCSQIPIPSHQMSSLACAILATHNILHVPC
jgi:hypothetical protein